MCQVAVTLHNSGHCDITNNRLIGNRIGFLSNSSQWITVANNTIVGNSEYGIQSTSGTKKLYVYWNHIGWNDLNAIANGLSKFWDHDDLGNWWSDYDNESDYIVPGSSNAIDRFPNIWNDIIGPDIHVQLFQFELDSVLISAEILEDVAVEQAVLSFSVGDESSWTNMTMDWSDSSWVATVEHLSAGDKIHYVVYANDYAGNWELTSEATYTISVETDSTTTQTTIGSGTDTNTTSGTYTNDTEGSGFVLEPLVIVGIVGAVAIISIVATLMYKYPNKFGRN